jgi:hypothetical protein
LLFLNGLLDMQLVQLIEYDLIKNRKMSNLQKLCFLLSRLMLIHIWLVLLIFKSVFGILIAMTLKESVCKCYHLVNAIRSVLKGTRWSKCFWSK